MVIPMSVVVAAKQAGISALLLLSVCNVESGMQVKNSFQDGHGRGSLGMCQISVEVARTFRPEADRIALQQPAYNLLVSALYLRQLQDKYHDNVEYTVAAYNAGYVFIENGQFKNQSYVDKVMTIYNFGEQELE